MKKEFNSLDFDRGGHNLHTVGKNLGAEFQKLLSTQFVHLKKKKNDSESFIHFLYA